MQNLREKEIEFIQKITAGVTHEIKNVLASIKELAGLMEDLLSMSKNDSFPHKEKFQKMLPKITEQVKRGNDITGQLNKFSHLTDETISHVDLNEVTEHLIFLNQRFARNKNILLQNNPADNAVMITTNPFHLELCLYKCIHYYLNNIDSSGTINFHPNSREGFCCINISYEGNAENINSLFTDADSSEYLTIIKEVITSINGSVEFGVPGLGIKLVLKEILKS